MCRVDLTLIFLLTASVISLAQVPNKIDFQAVARDATGEILASQEMLVRTSVIRGFMPGTIVYQEEHVTGTDRFGHFVIPVGSGDPIEGTFSEIDWSLGSYFLKIELDSEGSGNYLEMGLLEMMSVPYAFYAERSGNVNDADADPANELQQISIQGEVLSISQGNSVQIPDASSTNELQQLNFEEGNLLSISGGNTVQLPAFTTRWKENGQAVYLEQGKVGIGLSSPPSLLSVYDQNSAMMQFLTSTSGNNQKDGFTLGLNRLSHSAMVWNYEAGDIRMGTNDQTRLYINQFGRIGIGTTAPGDRLEVNGETSDVGIRIKAGEGRNATLSLLENHSNNYGFSWEYDGTDKKVFLRSHGFRNDSDAEIISVMSSGLVELGTETVRIRGRDGDFSTLSFTHEDYGSSALHLGIRDGFPMLDFTAQPFLVRASNRLALAIDDDSGYVGIGTDNPRSELDVRGSAEISGPLKVAETGTIEGPLTARQDLVVEGSLAVQGGTEIDGSVNIGNGASFNQIQEFTGTTGTGKWVDIAYPAGYTKSNTRVLSLQVQVKSGAWIIQGGDYDSPQRVTVYLFDNQIRILNPNLSDFENRPYRLLLLRMNN